MAVKKSIPTATRDTLAGSKVLGQMMSTDARDVSACMLESGIKKQEGGYCLFLAIPALLKRKEGVGKKASELNQEAQAKLNDVRRLALERELVPIAEVREMAASLATMTSQTVEDSALSMDEQNQLMERFADKVKDLFGEDGD